MLSDDIRYFCITKSRQCMEIKIQDFFTSDNAVNGLTEKEYKQAEIYVKAAKALARSSNQCVYIIDYFKQGFLYVSESLAYLCGVSAAEIKDFGYEMYIRHVPTAESAMLKEINDKGFALFNTFSDEEKVDCTITYDFHLTNGKTQRLINHKLTPLVLTKDGRIWLALCTVAVSAHHKPGKIMLRREGVDSHYEYDLMRRTWMEKPNIALSAMERDVLHLSAQGYTMQEIAATLCKSIDTVKACKRALFAKLDVKNIAEALSFVTNYKMLGRN